MTHCITGKTRAVQREREPPWSYFPPAEPVKLESQEELRRRRAGIACFL